LDADTFGNLNNWGQVLKTLENLRKKKKLDDHQSDRLLAQEKVIHLELKGGLKMEGKGVDLSSYKE